MFFKSSVPAAALDLMLLPVVVVAVLLLERHGELVGHQTDMMPTLTCVIVGGSGQFWYDVGIVHQKRGSGIRRSGNV